MAKDRMSYDRMVEAALRGVARKALERARDEGLPGEHHFYLTFRTDDPRTGISDALRARYPEEITIVLQHQYWDLGVDEAGFAVTLSFASVPERLEVPWGALTAFYDPSVQFGLQFEHRPAAAPEAASRTLVAPAPSEAAAPDAAEPAAEGEKVVTLDQFRKK